MEILIFSRIGGYSRKRRDAAFCPVCNIEDLVVLSVAVTEILSSEKSFEKEIACGVQSFFWFGGLRNVLGGKGEIDNLRQELDFSLIRFSFSTSRNW